jgi:hypothetical protein
MIVFSAGFLQMPRNKNLFHHSLLRQGFVAQEGTKAQRTAKGILGKQIFVYIEGRKALRSNNSAFFASLASLR